MNHTSSIAIIILAGLIHATFQLSVSTLTLLSGHAIGRQQSHKKLLRLLLFFITGVLLMTAVLLSFGGLLIDALTTKTATGLILTVSCGLLVGLGIAVWAFYYRGDKGTVLWLPRPMAHYLTKRAKRTSHSSEAFSLGMTSVIAELLFIVGPLLVASIALAELPAAGQLAGIIGYTVLAGLPLMIVGMLVGGGHRISGLQKWRERNKRFLQFISGSGLIVLGFYLFVFEVIGEKL